ncbi:MAG: ABC transporter ATP-binding protein [Methanosarcinaceae archaeon]|nr:ABC transporter ATP-binding protein [Methanosarcinaceae archaeon]
MLEVVDLRKSYFLGDTEIPILKGISFDVYDGEFISIVGPSGSGKSTLMNLLGCLDRPTSGKIYIRNKDVSSMNDNELSNLRGLEIGFIFQKFNLIPRMNALENVMLPTYANKRKGVDAKEKAISLLKKVGLEDRMHHKPNELSGGQSQRVAIARALINEPSIILADEPTGNLDTKTGDEVMELFQMLNKNKTTIIMITHNNSLAKKTNRIIRILDGKIDVEN